MLSSASALRIQRAARTASPALRAGVKTSSTSSDERKVTSENKRAARELSHVKNEVSRARPPARARVRATEPATNGEGRPASPAAGLDVMVD